MASGLNQAQLRFMVGEVPGVKNSDSLSVDVLGFVSMCVCVWFSYSKMLTFYFDRTDKTSTKKHIKMKEDSP